MEGGKKITCISLHLSVLKIDKLHVLGTTLTTLTDSTIQNGLEYGKDYWNSAPIGKFKVDMEKKLVHLKFMADSFDKQVLTEHFMFNDGITFKDHDTSEQVKPQFALVGYIF